MKRGGRSLVWTVTGMFLLTLVLGTVAQMVVAFAVLRPLETRDVRARSVLVASSLSNEVAAMPEPRSGAALDTLLAHAWVNLGLRRATVVFIPRGGGPIVCPPDRLRFLTRFLVGGNAPDTLLEHRLPGAPVHYEIVARRAVTRSGEILGEIQIVRPDLPSPAGDFLRSPTTLLFLPIALLASIIAGLAMVRLLVGRLRGLEGLAARVAEGDLSVRIDDTSGDEIGRLAVRLDRMTERLAEARAQIGTNERQRRQLFADITHELATPLTSIRGYAETLLDPTVPISADERTRYVRGVLDESRRLDRLIRDLFELARLEAGASPLEKEPLDWAALCRNTVERFQPRFRDAGLALAWSGPVEEAWIDADGHRIEEVLENLMVNALRYVPAGGSVALTLERPAGGRLRLTVRDDGPGLSPEELPLVFDRFYRGTGAARDEGGSGLGLAIVREIVERHAGAVRAEASPPHGLAVVVELPERTPDRRLPEHA